MKPRPRLSGLFNMTRRDLDRAIALARLTGLQHFLMQHAREESYTRSTLQNLDDSLPFAVNLTRLAEIANCDRKSVFDAYKGLIEAGVWTVDPSKMHHINKEFSSWKFEVGKDKGKPRFTLRQLEFIEAANDLATWRNNPGQVGCKHPSDNTDDQGADTLALGCKHPSDQGADTLVDGCKHPSADVVPHRNAPVRERERQRETEINTSLNAAADITPPHTPPHTYTHTRETPAAAEVEKPVRVTTLRELSNWFNTTYPDNPEYLGNKLAGFAAGYPVDQVQEAVEAAMVSAKRGLAAYVVATLRQWRANPERRLGKPNAPEPSAPSATPPKRGPYTLADKRAEQSRLRRAEAERETREALAKIAAEESAGIGGIHAR